MFAVKNGVRAADKRRTAGKHFFAVCTVGAPQGAGVYGFQHRTGHKHTVHICHLTGIDSAQINIGESPAFGKHAAHIGHFTGVDAAHIDRSQIGAVGEHQTCIRYLSHIRASEIGRTQVRKALEHTGRIFGKNRACFIDTDAGDGIRIGALRQYDDTASAAFGKTALKHQRRSVQIAFLLRFLCPGSQRHEGQQRQDERDRQNAPEPLCVFFVIIYLLGRTGAVALTR